MKRSGFLFAVFMLMAAVAFSGCGGGGGDDDNNTNPGKIGVALTEAAEFNGEDVMCAIFDSNAVDDEGGPAGNLLGSGIIVNVSDGSGSCVILEEDESEKIFDPGVYYLMAGIDLDGSGGEPNSGDKVMWLRPVTVNGDVTKNITGADFTITIYALRDTGPAGGLIFYLNPNHSTDGWRYLEAAPSDHSDGIQWYNGTNLGIAYLSAIGTGQTNTTKIVTAQGVGSYAAQVCNDLTIGDYSDWFLPSIDELMEMYNNLYLEGVGGFLHSSWPWDCYWSSSGHSMLNAYALYFDESPEAAVQSKELALRVRAIRAF